MTRARLVAGGLLLALVVACATAKGPVKMTEGVSAAGAWHRVLEEHTLRAQLWYGLVFHSADIDCTLVTPRLRSAFIADRDRFYGEIADDLAADLQNLGKRPDEGYDAPMARAPVAENEIVIYAALWAADTDFRDLGTDYTAWTIQLKRGPAMVIPREIDKLRNNEALAAIMPHVDRFDNVYVLRFPMVDADTGTAMFTPGGEPLHLEVKSALGVATFEWSLTGPADLDLVAPAEKTSAPPAPAPAETVPADQGGSPSVDETGPAADPPAPVDAPAEGPGPGDAGPS